MISQTLVRDRVKLYSKLACIQQMVINSCCSFNVFLSFGVLLQYLPSYLLATQSFTRVPPSAIYISVPLSLMQRWLMTWTSNLTATRRVVMGAGMGQHPRSDKTRPHTVNELPLSRGWRLADLSNDWSHTYKVQCSINWWAAQIKKKVLDLVLSIKESVSIYTENGRHNVDVKVKPNLYLFWIVMDWKRELL